MNVRKLHFKFGKIILSGDFGYQNFMKLKFLNSMAISAARKVDIKIANFLQKVAQKVATL